MRLQRLIVSALMLAITGFSQAEGKSLVATKLTPANIQSMRPGGPDAIAGLGDWLLGNGTVCAVIAGVPHEAGLAAWGGSLIDIGLCGEDNDQWLFNHLMPNMDKALILKPASISAEATEQQALVTVVAQSPGLETTSRYWLDLNDPAQLNIDHQLVCQADCPAISMLGILTLHPHRVLTPYTLSTIARDYASGFNHPGFNRFDTSSQLAVMLPNDISILLGADGLDADVSYGVQLYEAYRVDQNGEKEALPIFSITHPDYSLQAVLSRQPWIGGGSAKLGRLEMLQSLFMRLQQGDQLVLRQRIIVAASNDVAAITNRLYQGRVLRGTLTGKQGRVTVTTLAGEPITQVRVDKEGLFSAIIPRSIDRVRLAVITPWENLPVLDFDMNADIVDVGSIKTGKQTFIKFSAKTPVRVTVKGINVDDPKFYDELSGFSFDDALMPSPQSVNYISLAGDKLSSGFLPIKPGRYQLLASHGLEYGVNIEEFTVDEGDRISIDVPVPVREINTPGYLSADFHVHSGLSFDSSLPVGERLRSYAAQGGEVLIASEHNRLSDWAAALSLHQLDDAIAVIPGVELTGMVRSRKVPFTHGHQNVFPLVADSDEFSGGLPKHEGQRLRSLIWPQRQQQRIFQLNHPRDFDAPDPDLAYFENLLSGDAYNAGEPLTEDPNKSLLAADPDTGVRDIDVDLIEIANGNNYAMYQAVRDDWFSLLSQGEKIFGSANSDSHDSSQLVAMPVNYVAVMDDRLLAYQQDEFIESVRSGNFFGTTGPMLSLELSAENGEKAQAGEQISGRKIMLRLIVTAASWVPVERLNIYINGRLERSQKILAGALIELPLTVEADSYVVVEVDAEPGEIYQLLAPGFKPMAFSNPIFIDADSDGRWQPPGL